MRSALLLCLIAAFCPAAELPPGSYDCIYAQVAGEKHEVQFTLSRAEDGTITLRATGDPEVLTGRQVGDRLYLVNQRVDQQGIHVLQVIAQVGPDGYASGAAFRSLNAEMAPKLNFVLKLATTGR